MRRFMGVFSLIAAASLAACGPSGGIASASTTPASSAPSTATPPRVSAAGDVTAVAGNVIVKADAALSIAERAYSAAHYLAQIGIASGLISGSKAKLLAELDERASTALFFGTTAVSKAEQAAAAAKLLTIADDVQRIGDEATKP